MSVKEAPPPVRKRMMPIIAKAFCRCRCRARAFVHMRKADLGRVYLLDLFRDPAPISVGGLGADTYCFVL